MLFTFATMYVKTTQLVFLFFKTHSTSEIVTSSMLISSTITDCE